ncbi:MAG TPA: patatin-like phospholipase family protein [Acidimicrobiales bacterium]
MGDGIGICCSGGGIRSAAFNLGALQALDEAGVLRRADHLSAVSGGAYIASAYAIASRHSDPALLAERPAYAPGTPEESWVRNHCSYLTDGVADTARVVGIALVGLLANLVFFTTLLWTVARPLGWFYAWWQPDLREPAACSAALSPEVAMAEGCFARASLTGLGGWAMAAGVVAALGVALALGVRMFEPGWPLRAALGRLAGALVAAGAALAVVTWLLPELIVFTRNVLGGQPATGPVTEATGGASARAKGGANLGLIATVGGTATVVALVVQIAAPLRAVAETGTRAVVGVARWTGRLSRGLRRVANLVLGALVGPVALGAGALLILNGGARSASPSGGELALWAGMAALTLLMLALADVTSWSMHPYYKRRLARTFAAVRVPDGGDDGVGSGDDSGDDGGRSGGETGSTAGRGKAELLPYEKLMRLSEFAPAEFARTGRPPFPELAVCAAVNVSDPGTTPPGRGSLSFVFSPSRLGCPDRVVVSERMAWWRSLLLPAQGPERTRTFGPLETDTATYEARVGTRRSRDITLSAAVAMSGAAVAPTMGRMTRAPLRFLLALANVRLGVWLPNPANMPAGCTPDGGPLPANPRQVRLLFEVAGRHRARSRFVYVTDGGHIENLGLFELLRRRCTTIVCLDAAGGSTTRFATLGEALALAASELNVTIDIDPSPMGVQEEGLSACDHVTGTIRYPDGTTGTLVYGKALVTAYSPWDVRAYRSKDALFPVHPTADQLFGGETFDAYQALGRCVGRACAAEVDAVAPPAAPGRAPGRPDGHGPVPAGHGAPVSGVTDIRDIAAATAELS